MGLVRRHVWVSGRVQGVWYRQSCAEQARAAGVAGWVRNLPDGRVEAVFEGEEEAVDRMLRWCREGPRLARVDHLAVQDEALEGDRGFSVR